MREKILRRKLNDFWERTPRWFAVMEIQILLNITAKGFNVPGKTVLGMSPEKALREYARFTRSCVELDDADPVRLFDEAYKAGERIRRLTGFRDREDLTRLVFFLYKNIYIDMTGTLPGEITVSDCYFGLSYTPKECGIMSNVDSGIISGIFGGGRLEFTERITEGCGRCLACFREDEA